jgi:hypothetical protein
MMNDQRKAVASTTARNARTLNGIASAGPPPATKPPNRDVSSYRQSQRDRAGIIVSATESGLEEALRLPKDAPAGTKMLVKAHVKAPGYLWDGAEIATSDNPQRAAVGVAGARTGGKFGGVVGGWVGGALGTLGGAAAGTAVEPGGGTAVGGWTGRSAGATGGRIAGSVIGGEIGRNGALLIYDNGERIKAYGKAINDRIVRDFGEAMTHGLGPGATDERLRPLITGQLRRGQ